MKDANDTRIFVLRLRALPGVDAVRELRWVLKSLLRQHAFPKSIGEAAVAAAVKEIEYDGYEWAPAENRMMPEQSSDPVVQAKQRVHQQIGNWFEINGSADPKTAKLPFRITDVALLLREHRRLSEIVAQVRASVGG